DGGCEAGIGDEVQAGGVDGQIAARDLVLALSAGLHASDFILDGEFYGLIVTGLEVKELVGAVGTPVSAIQRLPANEVERAGHRRSVVIGHYQQDPIGHSGADLLEEGPSQVGAAPLAIAGIDVKSKEGLPVMRLDVSAYESPQQESAALGGIALLAD